jgi:hypothetical protein
MDKLSKAVYMVDWRKRHPGYQTAWKHLNVEAASWIKLGCRVKELGLAISFDKEHFIKLRSQPCYYCGDSEYYKTNIGYGLDKIVPSKGYVLENLVPACGPCNRMKMDDSQEEFYNRCKLILARKR